MKPHDYIAAVRSLAPEPSTCGRCGGVRSRFRFIDVDNTSRFACPACEAAPWFLLNGPAGDVWAGALRLPCDPCWAWIPESQRAAIAAFGMLGFCGTRRLHAFIALASHDGAVWAGDRGALLRLAAGPDALPEMERLIRHAPGVEPLRVDASLARFLTAPGYRALEVAEDIIPAQTAALVAGLHPSASWSWLDARSPVLAFAEDKPVAVVMPRAPQPAALGAAA